MKKRLATILFTGVAAATAIVLPATASHAATTWTVKAGGSFTASTGTGTVVFTDTNNGKTTTCSSSGRTPASSASGTLQNGSGLSNPLGTITSISFSNCTASGATSVSITGNTSTAWGINGDSFARPVTTGHISNVSTTTTVNTIFGSCTFTATGSGTTTYSNATGVLHLQSSGTTFQVKVISTSGGLVCPAVASVGDVITADTPPDSGTLGGYKVTTTGGPPQISSP